MYFRADPSPRPEATPAADRSPYFMVLAYLLFAGLWGLFADSAAMSRAAEILGPAEAPLFVAVTAALMYLVLRRNAGRSAQALQSARDSEARNRRFFESIPRPAWIFDEETLYVLAVNHAACREYGYEAAEFRQLRVTEILPPEDVDAFCDALITTEREFAQRWRHLRKDGTLRVVEVSSSPLIYGGRRARMAFVVDVTDKLRDEEQARLSAVAFANVAEAVAVVGAGGRLVTVNAAFEKLTHFGAAEVLGRPARLLVKTGAGRVFRALATSGRADGQVWCKRKDAAPFMVELSVHAARGADGKIGHYVAVARDMSKERAAEARIHALAFYDTLTGLPNRNLLVDRARQVIATHERGGRQFALLFVDLDNFKTINESFGHLAGDVALQAAARRIAGAMRESDTAARWGGDEFVALLPATDAEIAARIAQRVLDALPEPAAVGGELVELGACVGISIYPRDGTEFEALLKCADTAMRHAKDLGRNTWQDHAVPAPARPAAGPALAGALRQALINGDEMEVHYQPQLDLRTGMVVGFEALARWNHPRLGSVPPSRFIRVAEGNGCIAELGLWVLRRACNELKALSVLGYSHAKMAVNVSVVQLRNPQFARRCLEIVAECGIAPKRLELEVTESMLMPDRASVIAQLVELRKAGVCIAIDDFGTGFSSLSYLQHLPIDTVKIDRSFVRDMATDADACSIVRVIIGLAHSLHHQCVAEGVETREQKYALARLQCDCAQGFLFAEPLAPARLHQWLGRPGHNRRVYEGRVIVADGVADAADLALDGSMESRVRAIHGAVR